MQNLKCVGVVFTMIKKLIAEQAELVDQSLVDEEGQRPQGLT